MSPEEITTKSGGESTEPVKVKKESAAPSAMRGVPQAYQSVQKNFPGAYMPPPSSSPAEKDDDTSSLRSAMSWELVHPGGPESSNGDFRKTKKAKAQQSAKDVEEDGGEMFEMEEVRNDEHLLAPKENDISKYAGHAKANEKGTDKG